MNKIVSFLTIIFLLSVPHAAYAGATANKEHVGCSGGNKTYLYTWSYSPGGHPLYTTESKESGELGPWFTEFTSTLDSDCPFVGRGLPHGSYTHNWKTTGGSEETEFVNFYNSASCGPIP